MNPFAKLLPHVTQPWQPGMGGLGHRARYVEVKDRLGASPLVRQTPPARIPRTSSAIAVEAITDKIDIGVVIIGGPVLLKVIEEGRPIRQQVISFEIPQRKRKGMVDADVLLKELE